MRFSICLTFLMLSPAIFASEFRIHRDLSYSEPGEMRHLLDVYTSTESKDSPVVVWIHGGGWRGGDKSDVAAKPWAFVDRGFVFVSINYRFIPNATMRQIAGDVAKAIRWSHDHAKGYGGDPDTMFVMGHSAGASLSALICTDDRYLKAEGLPLSVVKGCVPVDGDSYDVPMQFRAVEPRRKRSIASKFGESEESQVDFSAVTHLARGKNIPPFLIVHVANPEAAARSSKSGSICCPETDVQSQRLATALEEVGVPATVYAAAGTNHTTLNAGLGLPDDKATKVLFKFLDEVLQK